MARCCRCSVRRYSIAGSLMVNAQHRGAVVVVAWVSVNSIDGPLML
jgi:hypothetical protein